MMHAAVCLLRARLQQVVKLSITPDELLNRKHDLSSCTRSRSLRQRQNWPGTLQRCSAHHDNVTIQRSLPRGPQLVPGCLGEQAPPPVERFVINRWGRDFTFLRSKSQEMDREEQRDGF